MKRAAWYALTVGVLLIVQWGFFIVSGSVPEFETEPWAIGHHIAAEMVLALTLLAGAWGVYKGKYWATTGLLLGLGMLIYSAINSSGYYSQSGDWGLVALFAVILASALWAVSNVFGALKGKAKPVRHRR